MTPPRDALSKDEWRARLLTARRARPAGERRAAQQSNGRHLLAAARELATSGEITVCAYLPLASEPLAPELPELVAAEGCRVLVPVATQGRPLEWAEFDRAGSAPGSFGIPEPTGPRLGSSAIAAADLVLIPALAVDQTGVRLGRGGGHYDRSLALLPPQWPGRTIAVVFDSEFVDMLPHDDHDRPIDAAVTPTHGIITLGRG